MLLDSLKYRMNGNQRVALQRSGSAGLLHPCADESSDVQYESHSGAFCAADVLFLKSSSPSLHQTCCHMGLGQSQLLIIITIYDWGNQHPATPAILGLSLLLLLSLLL